MFTVMHAYEGNDHVAKHVPYHCASFFYIWPSAKTAVQALRSIFYVLP